MRGQVSRAVGRKRIKRSVNKSVSEGDISLRSMLSWPSLPSGDIMPATLTSHRHAGVLRPQGIQQHAAETLEWQT